MAFVSNILVIGDGRNCCSALIALDETMITSWAATQEFGHLTAKRPVVEREYAQAIDGMHEAPARPDAQRARSRLASTEPVRATKCRSDRLCLVG